MDFDLTDEQRMWREAVHDFVEREVKPKAHEVDEKARFNWEAVRKMGPLGLLGLNVPEEYGGAGVDAVSAAIAIEELGWGCGSTALAIGAHRSRPTRCGWLGPRARSLSSTLKSERKDVDMLCIPPRT